MRKNNESDLIKLKILERCCVTISQLLDEVLQYI